MSLFCDDTFFSEAIRSASNFPLYQAIRDNPGLRRDRDSLDNWYLKFHAVIGDRKNQFINQFAQHPNSVIWQLGLMTHLEKMGATFEKSKSGGPDIVGSFRDFRFCMEVVASQMGRVESRFYEDGVCVEQLGRLDWRIVSRITQQLDEKIRKCQTLPDKTAILAVSSHGVDRAYLRDVMPEILFGEKDIEMPNGAVISLGYKRRLLSCGFKFLIYSSYDPIIYKDEYEKFLEVFDLERGRLISLTDLINQSSLVPVT